MVIWNYTFTVVVRREIALFAHVITSVSSLYFPYAPVVTMVTSVSSPVPVTHCMVKSVVTGVLVV